MSTFCLRGFSFNKFLKRVNADPELISCIWRSFDNFLENTREAQVHPARISSATRRWVKRNQVIVEKYLLAHYVVASVHYDTHEGNMDFLVEVYGENGYVPYQVFTDSYVSAFFLEIQRLKKERVVPLICEIRHLYGDFLFDANFDLSWLSVPQSILEVIIGKVTDGFTKTKELCGMATQQVLQWAVKQLHEAVTTVCPMWGDFFPWLKNVYTKFEAWVIQITEQTAAILSTVKELAEWGVAIISVTCLLIIIERFMLKAGIIDHKFGLAQNFVNAVLLTLGFTLMARTGDITMEKMAAFKSWLVETLQSIFCSFVKAAEMQVSFSNQARIENGKVFTEAQFNPVNMLVVISESIKRTHGRSLTEYGKIFSSISSIKAGASALYQMASGVFSCLAKLISELTGRDTWLLNDLGAMLGFDLPTWLNTSQNVFQTYADRGVADRKLLQEVLVLREIGRKILDLVLEKKVSISPAIFSVLRENAKKLEELFLAISLQGTPGPRITPCTFFFQGEAGIGKTIVAQKFMIDMCKQFGLNPKEQIYTRNCDDEYWTNYRRQFAVYYDDFGAISRKFATPDEQTLFPIVSSCQMPLNMAALNEKGLLFDSQMMVFTQNNEEPSAEAQIHDMAAFRRRRHFYFQVTLKQNVPFDKSNPTANQLYHLRKYNGDSYSTVQTFENYDDLFMFCLNGFTEHQRKEKSILDSMWADVDISSEHPSMPFDDLKALLHDTSICVSKSMGIEMPMVDGVFYPHFLTTEEGETFVWKNCDVQSIGKVFSGFDLLAAQSASRRMVYSYYHIIQTKKCVPAHIGLYLHFLAKDVVFTSVNYTASTESLNIALRPIIEEINMLPLWQRMILQHFGKCVGKAKKSWWNLAIEKVKLSLRAIYQEEIATWPTLFKILVGVVIAGTMGFAMWGVLSLLQTSLGGNNFAIDASTIFSTTQAQSERPNRANVAEYKFRNVPIRQRHWSKAQFDFEQSHSAILNRTLAMVRAGLDEIQVCMLPDRQFVVFRHFLARHTRPIQCVMTHNDQEYYFILDTTKPGNVIEWEDSELCVYRSCQLPMLERTSWDLICEDSEAVLGASFEAVIVGCKWIPQAGLYSPSFAKIDVRTCDSELHIESGSYVRTIKKYMHYEGQTIDGNCGDLIIAQIAGMWKIVGIHVSGNGTRGEACFLRALPRSSVPQNIGKYFELYDVPSHSEAGYSLVGWTLPGVRLTIPKKTNLVKLEEEEFGLGVPCPKVPSIVAKGDERLKGTPFENFDPFVEGMKKYKQPMRLLEEEHLSVVANDLLETWHDCSEGFTFEEVSLDVAINGIEGLEYFESLVLNTSEGFPYILERKNGEKGKSRFMEGQPGEFQLADEQILEDLSNLEKVVREEIPELICIECPKDEKVVPRKVFEQPKTRLFSILPFPYNLLVRRKFLNFVRFIMKNKLQLPCKVGINPHSRDWGQIADKLLEVGNEILCCDYKLFDGLMSKQIMVCIADMINELCGGGEIICAERKNLLLGCISRYGICKDALYRVECGIPSGFPLTVIINSIFNELLVRYCYRTIMLEQVPKEPFLAAAFDKYVRLATYGDDNLISVSPVVSRFFNGENLQRKMLQIGITITDGVDKTLPTLFFRPIQECDFLKRKFVHRGGLIWDAPIELESLWAQLHYVSDKHLGRNEAFAVNIVNVLRELYMHDPSMCSEMRHRAINKYPWIKAFGIPTMSEIAAHFDKQRGFLGYKGATVSLDLLMNPTLLGHIERDTDAEFMSVEGEIVPNISIISKHRFVKTDQTYEILLGNIGTQRPITPSSMDLRWATGTGRGSLPTTMWLTTRFLNPRSETHKTLWQAYKSGKHLQFVCYTGNNVVAMVMATMFARSINKLHVENSSQLLTKCIQVCAELKYLPRDFPQMFWAGKLENKAVSVITGNNFKFAEIVKMVPQVKFAQMAIDLKEDDRQDSNLTCMRTKLMDARNKTQSFPCIVEDTGYEILPGTYPGAQIKYFLISKYDQFWKRQAGKKANIISCVGKLCNKDCEGHVVIKKRTCEITDQFRDDLYGFEKFSRFDGKYSDQCERDVASPRSEAVQAALLESCNL